MRKLFVLVMVLIVVSCVLQIVRCEDAVEEAWIICNPESCVIMREKASRKSCTAGYLYVGDKIETDGKVRNGFLHLVNVSNEIYDGWVNTGYVTYFEPETCKKSMEVIRGKTAARSCVKGDVKKRLKKGTIVTVYAFSEEWSVTSAGYIMTKFLEDVDEKGERE